MKRPPPSFNHPRDACDEGPPAMMSVAGGLGDPARQWGPNPGGPPNFDGDGNVGVSDFLALLANWGPCP